MATMRPGDNPIANLAASLVQPEVLGAAGGDLSVTTSLVQATLRRGSRGLVEACREASLPGADALLVIVDQFEELFRFIQESRFRTAGSDAQRFVDLLLEAARDDEVPIYIALTMRAEFLGHCPQFRELPDAINEGVYLVPRLNREQLRETIEINFQAPKP